MRRLSLRAALGPRGKRRKLNIAAIPNCEFWVDCARTNTITYASGSNVTLVNDLSGKNRHLTKTGSGNDTIYPVYNTAEKGLTFLNSAFDQMVAGAIGDWDFMHTGNGCSILLMLKIDAAASGNGVIMATSSDVAAGIGTNLWYYNTNQNLYINTRNGSGQPFAHSGANNSLSKNTTSIISVHMQNRTGNALDLVTRNNGATDLNVVGPLSAYGAGNSTGPLMIGKPHGSTPKCRMVFKKCAIFSRRLSKAEENLILESWAAEENTSLTRYAPKTLAVISGQSNATGYGQIAQSSFAGNTSVPNAFIFNNSTFAFATLNAGTNNLGHSSTQMGMEMTLGQSFVAQSGQPLYMVKYAIEGQDITTWNAGGANFTNLQNAMQRAVWNLEDAGHTVKPFFIWFHGESDTAASDNATNYQPRLQTFLGAILGATPGFAQAPSYIVQIDQDPAYAYTDVVRAAQMQACLTAPYSVYVHFVETGDLAAHEDRNHFTAAAQEALGTRVALRYLGNT